MVRSISLMRRTLAGLACVLALVGGASAQTTPSFEVAVIKPSAPLDMAKLAADMQAGKMPKLGVHIDGSRAEYIYLSLKDLMVMAYGVKPYQITGPDWLAKQRFDVVAKMPDGAKKDAAPKMLQALLEERFHLVVHRNKAEHPVLGLVVGKGGPKLKESAEKPVAIDENTPLKPGEMTQEGPDGPVRVTVGKAGSATVNMGSKGMMSYGVTPGTQTFHLEGKMITMSGFADMLTQFMQMGGPGGRQIVDMTGLTGFYEIAMDFSIADLLQMARAAGMDIPAGAPGAAPGGNTSAADAASEPGGSSSTVTAAVQAVGLKLENRKAMVEQLIVDSADKMPTAN